MMTARTLLRRTRPVRAAILAGGVSGLVAGGLGGRLVMRLIALVDDSPPGLRSDSGALVGEFTLGGTLGLLIFGAVSGSLFGLLYVLLRRWIPASPLPRGLTFGVFLLAFPGVLILNEDNPDMQIFEPVLLFYAALASLFIMYGAMTASLADVIHPEANRRASTGRRRVIGTIATVGAVAFLAANLGGILEAEGTCLRADGNGGCAIPAVKR